MSDLPSKSERRKHLMSPSFYPITIQLKWVGREAHYEASCLCWPDLFHYADTSKKAYDLYCDSIWSAYDLLIDSGKQIPSTIVPPIDGSKT